MSKPNHPRSPGWLGELTVRMQMGFASKIEAKFHRSPIEAPSQMLLAATMTRADEHRSSGDAHDQPSTCKNRRNRRAAARSGRRDLTPAYVYQAKAADVLHGSGNGVEEVPIQSPQKVLKSLSITVMCPSNRSHIDTMIVMQKPGAKRTVSGTPRLRR